MLDASKVNGFTNTGHDRIRLGEREHANSSIYSFWFTRYRDVNMGRFDGNGVT